MINCRTVMWGWWVDKLVKSLLRAILATFGKRFMKCWALEIPNCLRSMCMSFFVMPYKFTVPMKSGLLLTYVLRLCSGPWACRMAPFWNAPERAFVLGIWQKKTYTCSSNSLTILTLGILWIFFQKWPKSLAKDFLRVSHIWLEFFYNIAFRK